MALDDGELESILDEWRRRDCRSLGVVVQRNLGRVSLDLSALFEHEEDVSQHEVERVAASIVDGLAASPHAELLTVVYLYGRALSYWQLSTYRWPLALFRAVTVGLTARGNEDEQATIHAVCEYAAWLDDGYDTENGLNCSCPIQTGETAHRVEERAAAFLEVLPSLHATDPAVLRILGDDATAHRAYFGSVARIADAVCACFMQGPDASALEAALHDVRESLRMLQSDSHGTNLGPQVAMLESLAGSTHQARLRINAARITYLYPFALLLAQPDPRDGTDEVQIASDLHRLAIGQSSWDLKKKRLSDLWRDPRDALLHTVELPDVVVTTTTPQQLRYSVEIRMRQSGNHELRLSHEFRLPAGLPASAASYASLHLLNQALRRPTFLMGHERVCWSDGGVIHYDEPDKSVPDFVMYVLDEVARALHAKVVPSIDSPAEDVHVLVSKVDAVVEPSQGESRRATPEDLFDVLGSSLLTREVRQAAATTVEEWLLRGPSSDAARLPIDGRDGELVLATANTTVLYMPSSPDWVVLHENEEMAAFVTSQQALFRKWHAQLDWRRLTFEGSTRSLPEALKGEVKPPDLDAIQSAKLALTTLEVSISAELSRLQSLSLARSRSYRDFLDALTEASSIPRMKHDLQVELQALAARYDHVAAMTETLDQRRHQEGEWSLQVVVGVLALFGVVSWVRDLVDKKGWEGALWGLGTLLMSSAVFLAGRWLLGPHRRARRPWRRVN